jgi:O-antigen biosynthesis protein WbqP
MRRFYARYGKRILDMALSGLAIVALSPLLLAIALWIKLDSAGPVFFRQKRVGKNKRIFRIYKFRTMRVDAPHDTPTHLLNNPAAHITRCGRILRKTSLDELPQLFNIFAGQMSIVGPRPALWNQADLVAEREKYGANAVAPGLTGLAQISGRDALTIGEKAKLDGAYAKRLSFAVDCRYMFHTVFKVLKNDGVVEGGAEKGDNASQL